MKFITRYPKIGDKRIVEKFLLFPLTIKRETSNGTRYETRWLEKVAIKQVYKNIEVPTKFGYSLWRDCWVNVSFEEKY